MSASSPEELETLLEDAVLLGDDAAVRSLFDDRAVLVTGDGTLDPSRALGELALIGYVASARSVRFRRDLAVAVGASAVNVSCRGTDGGWVLVAAVLRS